MAKSVILMSSLYRDVICLLVLKLRQEVYNMHEKVKYINELSIKGCDMSIDVKTKARSV